MNALNLFFGCIAVACVLLFAVMLFVIGPDE